MTSPNDITLDKPRYEDHPEFTPDLSPHEILKAGSFGGGYFHDEDDVEISGIHQEILEGVKFNLIPNDRLNNAFKTKSGLSREEWVKRGWMHDQDPLGWFQWYCRFHSGRRTEDDTRQITRWADFKKRWQPKSREALERMNPGPGTRQALLHWGIDPWLPERGLGIGV